MKKLVIGFSGSGTTFEAIIDAIKNGSIALCVPFVFSDRPCLAAEKAMKMGIPVIIRENDENIADFHVRIKKKILSEAVDIVALAGYLRLFPVAESDKFLTINSHPGAIPEFGGAGFYGARVHDLVLSFARSTRFRHPFTYSTVHVASDAYDEGEVLGLVPMAIRKGDTAQTISKRLLPIEHKNYTETLARLAKGKRQKFPNPKNLILPEERLILTEARRETLKKFGN